MERNFCVECGTKMPPKNKTLRCAKCSKNRCASCDAKIPYSGRGRPKKWCDDCRALMELQKLQPPSCVKCGAEIDVELPTKRRVCSDCLAKHEAEYQRRYYMRHRHLQF